MKQYIKKITLFSITTILILLSQLAQGALIASVSTNKVVKGEIFILKIVSDKNVNSEDIDFSILKDNFYIGRPSFSSSRSSINGQRSVRNEWSLSLAPIKAGILTIPSFSVAGDSTTEISITSMIPNQLDSSSNQQDDLVLFQTTLSKNTIYPGEVVRLDTKLIVKADARRIQAPKLTPPNSNDALDINAIGEAKEYMSVIDGIESIIVEQSYHISTAQAGNATITGPQFSATILEHNRRIGSSRLIPVSSKPDTISLHILEKPANFKGTWLPSPNLSLSQKWFDDNTNKPIQAGETETTVGSPISRQITLSVEGIAQSQLPNIKVNYPENVRYYDEPPKFVQDGNTVLMTLKHVLIPKSSGEITLPSITIHWWNTVKKESQTAHITGLKLIVTNSDTPNITLTNQETLQMPVPQTITETITVKDPGIWPYLTAFFALLWVITACFLFKKRTSLTTVASVKKAMTAESDTFHSLLTAVEKGDGVRAQIKLQEWYQENPQLDPSIIKELDSHMVNMMAYMYSEPVEAEEVETWKTSHLIRALNKAKKAKPKQSKDSDTLAPL